MFSVGTYPFEIKFDSSWLHKRETFPIWYEITCPRFSKLVKGQFVLRQYMMTLELPDND